MRAQVHTGEQVSEIKALMCQIMFGVWWSTLTGNIYLYEYYRHAQKLRCVVGCVWRRGNPYQPGKEKYEYKNSTPHVPAPCVCRLYTGWGEGVWGGEGLVRRHTTRRPC
jgi:hypothetical protein